MAATGAGGEEGLVLTPGEVQRFMPAQVLHNSGNGKVSEEEAKDKRCNALAFSDDGEHLVASFNDRSMHLIHSETGEVRSVYSHAISGCQSVTFTHHNEFVLFAGQYAKSAKSGTRGMLMYHSLFENRVLRLFKGHLSTVTDIAVCPGQDTFLSTGLDGQVFLWDIRAPNPAFRGEVAFPAALMPDGSENKYIAAAAGKDIHSGVLGQPSVAVDAHGTVFAVAAPDHSISLFDARNPVRPFLERRVTKSQEDGRLKLDPSRPMHWQGMAFSKDGKFLTTTSYESGVIVLDTAPGTRTPLSIITAASTHGSSACGCALTPDSKYLVTGNAQGMVWAYDMQEMPQKPTGDELAADSFAAMQFEREARGWVPSCYPLGTQEGLVKEEGDVSLADRTKHSGPITAVAVHPTRAMFASADSSVALWQPVPRDSPAA